MARLIGKEAAGVKGLWSMLDAYSYMRSNPTLWPRVTDPRERTEAGLAFYAANANVNGSIAGVACWGDLMAVAFTYAGTATGFPQIFMFKGSRFVGAVLAYNSPHVVNNIQKVSFTPDGKWLYLYSSVGVGLLACDTATGLLSTVSGQFWNVTASGTRVLFTGDGKYLTAGAYRAYSRDPATGTLTGLGNVVPDPSAGDASDFGNGNQYSAAVAPTKDLICFFGNSGYNTYARAEFYNFADGQTNVKTTMTSEVIKDNTDGGGSYTDARWSPDGRYCFLRRPNYPATGSVVLARRANTATKVMANLAWPTATGGAVPNLTGAAATIFEADDTNLYFRNSAGQVRGYRHTDDTFTPSVPSWLPDDGWNFQIDVHELASTGGRGQPSALWRNAGGAYTYPTVRRIPGANPARV